MKIENVKTSVIEAFKGLETADNSSKALFNDTIVYLKTVKDLNSGITAMKNLIAEEGENYSVYYKNKLNQIVRYSVLAVESKLSLDTDMLYWYNIEKALRLMEHLMAHHQADVNKIKNLLNSLKGKAKNKRLQRADKNTYNDLYASKLADLYKEYRLEEDDDKKAVKIETLFGSLDLEHKKAIIAKLQASLEEK